MNEYIEKYLDERGDKMPSLINFRKWMREVHKIRAHTLDGYHEGKGELNMLHEDWLQEKASAGGRHSAIYIQLLKQLQEKMARLREEKPSVPITLDLINDGKNSI